MENRPKQTRQIEFSVPITLEEARERLHDLADQQFSGRFSGKGKLKVDETVLNVDTSEFRVWVWPNAPDVEFNGFLNRSAETETLVTGETKIGCFSYYVPVALLAVGVYVLATSSLQASAIFLLWLVIGEIWAVWYIRKSRIRLVSIVENKLRGRHHTDTKFVSIESKNV
jgi:hypothetical protein